MPLTAATPTKQPRHQSLLGNWNWKKLLLGLTLGLAGLIVAISVWSYRVLTQPTAHHFETNYFTIPKGASTQTVVAQLNAAGLLQHPRTFLLYLTLTGSGNSLKAGDYRFPSPISPLQLLSKLQTGQQRSLKITIIEGWTRWDVAQALTRFPELGVPNQAAALKLMDDTRQIRDLDPQATNLEGYLYPDTYFFAPDTTAAQLLQTMVTRTRRILSDQETNALRLQKGLSVRQVLTVASLIETEAKLSSERPLVASVIYNRLQRNIPLGIDSTIIYASKLAGKWKNDGKVYQSDLDRMSPYNTRKITGLPPGPIASPSAASISATLQPASSDYLYYVRNPDRNDGAHNFYANDADFQRGVQALRAWEQAQGRR